jgi:cell division protein FtsN
VIQVGAFTTRERAQAVARRLIEKGYPAKVVAGEAEGQVAYVVHAAGNDQVSAQKDLDNLCKDYPDAFLKRLDGQGQ